MGARPGRVRLPALVGSGAGRRVLLDATFLDAGHELDRSYDLVVASGSLQYAEAGTGSDGRFLFQRGPV
jgi:hypothetical protein